MINQSEEIFDFIKSNPGTNTEDVAQGTGWNRYLVEKAIKIMLERKLVISIGKTEWGDPVLQATV
jgi:hypothetical protein